MSLKNNLENVSPNIRALLTTDGSFTILLEAFTGEKIVAHPIESTAIAQSTDDSRIALLQVAPDDRLLFRSALLKTVSGKIAAYVESITVLGRTSEKIQAELSSGSSKPIGKMLREERLETFRDIVEMKMTADSKSQKFLGEDERPVRTYVIFANKLPLMAITEYINIS